MSASDAKREHADVPHLYYNYYILLYQFSQSKNVKIRKTVRLFISKRELYEIKYKKTE